MKYPRIGPTAKMMGMVVRIPSCLYIEYLSSDFLLKVFQHWFLCVFAFLKRDQATVIGFYYNIHSALSQVFLESAGKNGYVKLIV